MKEEYDFSRGERGKFYNADGEFHYAADAFEASFSSLAAGEAAKVRSGMIIVRILDGIVKNRYSGDPGKLAAWVSASHVEKAPKKKEPTTP
ncbi:MAG: hypothetical protein ACT4O9_15255 [Blastocatellia bacterium]